MFNAELRRVEPLNGCGAAVVPAIGDNGHDTPLHTADSHGVWGALLALFIYCAVLFEMVCACVSFIGGGSFSCSHDCVIVQ